MKKEQRGIDPVSKPSGNGCVECLASPEGWWFHLRRCAKCGHIGCCDSSSSQHASKHAAKTGHPIIASFEPGEDWFYDYEKRKMIRGVKLASATFASGGSTITWTGSERFQRTGNHCCTSWRRSMLIRGSGTRETVLVMSTVSKGAIK